jgi:hypothetical protein
LAEVSADKCVVAPNTSENAPSEFKLKLPCGQIWVTLARVLVQVGQGMWGSVVDMEVVVWVQAEVRC